MFLALINQCTVLANADVLQIARACEIQIRMHVAPLWNRVPSPIVYFSSGDYVPAHADLLVLLDNSDQAGALGYHRETPDGKPYARAFIKTALQHAGPNAILDGDTSASTVVSHEVCEWFINPNLNLWADGPGGLCPLEIADPVQDVSYKTMGVSVGNFVTPSYFDQQSPRDAQFDYLNKLSAPFSLTPGGYRLIQKKGGDAILEQGGMLPDWKMQDKTFAAARTSRLLDAAASGREDPGKSPGSTGIRP